MKTDSDDSLKQTRFDLVDDRVVTLFKTVGEAVHQDLIEDQHSFEISRNQVVDRKIKSNEAETKIYIDESGYGQHMLFSQSETDSDTSGGSVDSLSSNDNFNSNSGRKSFEFEIINGAIVRVFEVKDGQLGRVPIEVNEIYSLDDNSIIRIERKSFGIEIQRFSDSDEDGRYQRFSEQWMPDSENVGNAGPIIEQPLVYYFTDDSDLIAVRDDDPVSGGGGADSFVFRFEPGQPNHWKIEDFHSAEDDRLVFDTGIGLTSKEHLAGFVTELSYEGQNFFVGFSSEITITLTGVTPASISWDNVDVLS
ncbi:hypothetical protein [Nitrosomonas marina]|uniref:Uncharacterized protein n=1 Tax=Nitrosomonas marina TaxID=917 RepID=A0A1H8B8C5_9PROT|nr:hypothetical protein [Nitrosomonas marina]SEM79102.1 hypothetical protein SAMN05216325_102156 [Nitrosomonas marina]